MPAAIQRHHPTEFAKNHFNSSTNHRNGECDDTGFLVGLFKAFNEKNFRPLEPVDKNVQSSYNCQQSASPINFTPASFRRFPGLSISVGPSDITPREFSTKCQTGYLGFHNISPGKLRRRHCNSESDIGPQVEFDRGTLRESLTHCLSLITLSSCIELSKGNEASIAAVNPDKATEVNNPQSAGKDNRSNEDGTECLRNDRQVSLSVLTISPINENVPNCESPIGNNPLPCDRESCQILESEGHSSVVTLPTSEDNGGRGFLVCRQPSNSTIRRTPSTRLIKTVSFADEMGKSLTETFVFDSDVENHPAYNIDGYGNNCGYTSLNIQRKNRLNEKRHTSLFTRSRLKCPIQDHRLDDYCQASDYRGIGEYSDYEAPTPVNRNVEQMPTYVWNITFPQPAAQYYEFRKKVESQSVSLESLSLNQSYTNQLPDLSGTIKVLNLAYVKQVWLRITVDNWKTFTEQQAVYSQLLSGNQLQSPARFDTFTFQIPSSSLLEPVASSVGAKRVDQIEFAIRYSLDQGTRQYWDNNNGQNYLVERSLSTTTWPHSTDRSCLSAQRRQIPPSQLRHDAYGCEDHCTISGAQSHPYTAKHLPDFSGVASFTDYRVWNHFVGEAVYY